MEFKDSSSNPYDAPSKGPRAKPDDDAIATIIPYKNGPALAAYYIGLFSLVACIPIIGVIGIIMSITAIVLGFKGLKKAGQSPEAHGRLHAWFGIVSGFACLIVGSIINVAMAIAFIGQMMDG